MSAPNEVWVSQKMTFVPMGKKMRVWYAYDDRGDNTVIKYLRADLTCGECQTFFNINDGNSIECARTYNIDHCAEDRGCFDFVTKGKP